MAKNPNGEGGIGRRKDGRWAGSYTVQTATGPKRRYVYGRNRKDVAAKLAKAVADRDSGLVFDAGNLTLGDYLGRWLDDSVRDSVKRRTYESYVSIVRRHIAPGLGRIKLAALTPAHVQGLYRTKLDSGLSPTSVEHIHTTLHRALKQAVKWQLVPRNVCGAVTVPSRARTDFRPLSGEQAKALLTAARGDRLEALYVLAVTTGMRQGEILGLCWHDVDLGLAAISVRRTLVTGYGKQTYERPKTVKGQRSIALTAGTVDALRIHRAGQRAAGLYTDGGPVFCNRVGGPLHPKNLLDRSFRPLLQRAGLPPIRFHDLRHTAAPYYWAKASIPR